MRSDALSILQLDDAHRALLTAICSLRLVAGNATDATLLAEVQRLHAGLCSAADELAELKARARIASTKPELALSTAAESLTPSNT